MDVILFRKAIVGLSRKEIEMIAEPRFTENVLWWDPVNFVSTTAASMKAPWCLCVLLALYAKKHRFHSKAVPNLTPIKSAVDVFVDKLKWKWEFWNLALPEGPNLTKGLERIPYSVQNFPELDVFGNILY